MSAAMACLRGALDFGGRGKIGKALREIDGLVRMRQARHFANHGFGEESNFVGKFDASCQPRLAADLRDSLFSPV